MRALSPAQAARAAYEAALAAHDGDAAAAAVIALLDAGTAPTQVITDVIAVAQRAVGGRWQRGEWTVAEEHAATASRCRRRRSCAPTSGGRRPRSGVSSSPAPSASGTSCPP